MNVADSTVENDPVYRAPGYAPAAFDAATQMSPLPPVVEGAYPSTFRGADEGAFPEEHTARVGGNELADEHLAAAHQTAEEDDRDVYDPALPSFTAVGAARSLEDELEDADDYASRGYLNEALGILRALQNLFLRHPLVAARVRDLQIQRGQPVAAEGGTQQVDVDDMVEVDPEELDHDDDVAAAMGRGHGHGDALGHARPSVVLGESIEDNDADTHFDLGLAYKEMGLHDAAIKAFDKVVAPPHREVQSRMMVGLCYRERGDLAEAVHRFTAGLHPSTIPERERQTLLYEIVSTCESLGDLNETATSSSSPPGWAASTA